MPPGPGGCIDASTFFRDFLETRDEVSDSMFSLGHNEERPKKGLGGLTPFQYAKRLVRGTQYSHHRTLNRSATEDGGTS